MATFNPNAAAPDTAGVFGLPHSVDEAHVVLVPVPFEATTSYGGGTSEGPRAILEASRQVDLFDIETGRPYERGIAMLEVPPALEALNQTAKALAAPIIEAGGAAPGSRALAGVNALCEQMNDWVYRTVKAHLGKQKLVGTVGGDHSISFGAIRAHAEAYPGLGVLHLDAHADLRDAYEGFSFSHASIMHNVMERIPQVGKLVQVAIRDLCDQEFQYIAAQKGRIVTHYDALLASARFEGETFGAQLSRMVADLPHDVYLSFDIDGLDPTLCPGTGTPVPGGLSFAQADALIAAVTKSGRRIVGFDLTEVSPGADGGQWDGNVGARLLYKMIGWSLKSRA